MRVWGDGLIREIGKKWEIVARIGENKIARWGCDIDTGLVRGSLEKASWVRWKN